MTISLSTALLIVFQICNITTSISSVIGFQIKVPIPGGKSISYNHDTGLLRIQTATDIPQLQIPPAGTKPSTQTINSIVVQDTGIPQKGYGAFVVRSIAGGQRDDSGAIIPKGSFLGFYEGDVIVTREALDDVIDKRRRTNSETGMTVGGEMDYVMSVDGGVTFIDGYIRAQNKTSFSTVHLNHADKGTFECNCVRVMENNQVAFFTSRDVNVNEELCFDYGSNFWRGRDDKV